MKNWIHHFLWIGIACLALVAPSAEASLIFYIGTDNNSANEFEQEGTPRNDRNYYWENGDYTGTTGLDGAGVNWSGGMEIWQDGPASVDWDDTIDGFPRALVGPLGISTNNIFFQLEASEVTPASRLNFVVDVQGGRADTTHDLEFRINGNLFHTVTGRDVSPGLITASIDPTALGIGAGPAVLSMARTGGTPPPTGQQDFNWIIWDYTSLTAVVPEPTTALALIGLLAGTSLRRTRRKVA